jgi:hypothetical protein
MLLKIMNKDAQIQLLYGSFSFYISIINSLFILYHVDAYVNLFKINKNEFWIGETIFMIWNCLNDPLFAWLSDRSLLTDSQNAINIKFICIKRLKQLKYYGPALALFFLFMWFPFSTHFIWLQFPLCLCLYDSFLTICDLQYSALLADLEVSSLKRNNFNYYSSLFASIGVISIFISYPIWKSDNFSNFQLYCILISIIAFIGFCVSSSKLSSYILQSNNSNIKSDYMPQRKSKKIEWNLVNYIKLLPRHKNLFYFSILNLIQVFSCHFNSNFFPLFIDIFFNGNSKSLIGSGLLGFSFLIPHLLNMYLIRFCDKYGTYEVIKNLFIVKLLFALLMLAIGSSYYEVISIFLLSNRIFTEGICKLLNLIIADLTDEDFVLNERPQPISALIYGTTSFLAKPGQTFAPLIGTLFITYQTGIDVFYSSGKQYYDSADFKKGCFKILLLVPICTALLQLLLWKKFDLHSNKLRLVKHKRMHAENQFFI